MSLTMRVAALAAGLVIATPVLLLVLHLGPAAILTVCAVGVVVTVGEWWVEERRRGARR